MKSNKMRGIKIMTLSAILLVGMSACNKTKSTSNKFIKAGEWTISELSVDGTNEDELPIWEIEDCDLYNESCFGEWKNDEGGHAEFIWQFREKANTLEISHQIKEEEDDHDHEGEEHDHAAEEAAEQAYNFSGVYEVVKNDKESMEFSSSSTAGFPGQAVVIKIEKK
ncbi:MAG: hypothetical protein AB8B74_02485 [Crocinitomicaceae bacterium]